MRDEILVSCAVLHKTVTNAFVSSRNWCDFGVRSKQLQGRRRDEKLGAREDEFKSIEVRGESVGQSVSAFGA